MVKAFTSSVLALFAFWMASSAAASIEASVDRAEIERGESLTLQIKVAGNVNADPDFTPLEEDWKIESRQRRSKSIVSRFSRESSQSWRLTIAPKRSGDLVIPSLTWNGEQTTPIRIKVIELSPEAKSLVAQLAFFKTSVSHEVVKVQQQILYKVELFYSGNVQLVQGLPPPPDLQDAVVQKLGPARSTAKNVNGVPYGVTTLIYAIFPQAEGDLILAPEKLSAYISVRSLYRNRKRVEIESPGHQIKVEPRPPEYPQNATWLPATSLELEEAWDPPNPQMTAGLPVVRKLSIKARGLPFALLPEIVPTNSPGVRFYPDPPANHNDLSTDGVTGSRVFAQAIVPTAVGDLKLPEVAITWWDLEEERVRVARVPGRSFKTIPGYSNATPPAPPVPSPPSGASDPTDPGSEPQAAGGENSWKLWAIWLLALAVIAGWGIAAALFARLRNLSSLQKAQETPLSTNPKPFFRKLREACAKNDPAEAKLALMRWVYVALPAEFRGRSLESLIPPDDTEGRRVLELLSEKLYKDPDRHWDGQRLLDWAPTLSKRHEDSQNQKHMLPGLYPASS